MCNNNDSRDGEFLEGRIVFNSLSASRSLASTCIETIEAIHTLAVGVAGATVNYSI